MRLMVRLVGQLAPSKIIKVDLDGEPAEARMQLMVSAARALGVRSTDMRTRVRIYLDGGHDVDDVALLEKDDILYFAFDGGAWRTPVAADEVTQPSGSSVDGGGALGGGEGGGDCGGASQLADAAAQLEISDEDIVATITRTDATLAWSAARLRTHLKQQGVSVSEKRLKRLKSAAPQAPTPVPSPEAEPAPASAAEIVLPAELTPTLEGDEVLAVITADVLRQSDVLAEEGVHPPGRYTAPPRALRPAGPASKDRPRLLCELRDLKARANASFKAGDMAGALEMYRGCCGLFESSPFDDGLPEELTIITDLMAAVHANRAQVLLNMARHDEAATACFDAIRIPRLHDSVNRPLRKKVLQRLEASGKPPSAKAVAAGATATPQRKEVSVSEDDLLFVTLNGRCSEEAARYLMQLAEGNLPVACTLALSAREKVWEKKLVWHVRHSLARYTSQRVTEAEAGKLLTLLGVDLRKLAAERAAELERSELGAAALERLVEYCRGALHDALVAGLGPGLAANPAAQAALARAREWLSAEYWAESSVARFLATADGLLGIGKRDELSQEARAAFGTGAEDFTAAHPVGLRVLVEMAWISLDKAIAMIHCNEWERDRELGTATTAGSNNGVSFMRVQQHMRLTGACGPGAGEEPILLSEKTPDALPPKAAYKAAASLAAAVDEAAGGTGGEPGAVVRAPPPRLADLACLSVQKDLELEAAKRGHVTRCALEEALHDDRELDFEPYRWIFSLDNRALRASLPQQLPVVDDVWHLSMIDAEAPHYEMTKSLADAKAYRPKRIEVTAERIERPPRPSQGDIYGLRGEPPQSLPAAAACKHFKGNDRNRGGMGLQEHQVMRRVLLEAAVARGGRPKRLIFGPHGALQMVMFYLEVENPTRRVPDGRGKLEAFVSDVLGVEDQRLEGWWDSAPRSSDRRGGYDLVWGSMSPAENRARKKARGLGYPI